jgi:hypothetical protein
LTHQRQIAKFATEQKLPASHITEAVEFGISPKLRHNRPRRFLFSSLFRASIFRPFSV